jgi:hypothetical protein
MILAFWYNSLSGLVTLTNSFIFHKKTTKYQFIVSLKLNVLLLAENIVFLVTFIIIANWIILIFTQRTICLVTTLSLILMFLQTLCNFFVFLVTYQIHSYSIKNIIPNWFHVCLIAPDILVIWQKASCSCDIWLVTNWI